MKKQRVKEVSENKEVNGTMKRRNMKHGLGKKITGMALAVLMLMGCLTGCGGTSDIPTGDPGNKDGNNASEEIDESKTQLVVATFDGGLGSEWLREAGERFEKLYADVSFEEGKKGVQVSVVRSAMYQGTDLLSSLPNENADVWFTENVEYYAHVNVNNFADITDIVTEDLKEFGEDKSIEDKIDEDYRNYLNAGTEAKPVYYAVPFYDSFYGLTYDRDVFAKYNLYFKASGSEAGDAADTLGFVSSKKDKKSAGVDGKYGTYDDGLPATYAQFHKLTEKMVQNDITPLIYAGSNASQYPMRAASAFWAQAEGAEGYRLNVTFDGKADKLVKLDSNGKVVKGADGKPVLESLKITENNGYELQRQVSKYNVLKFYKEILNNSKNYSASNFIHTAAQSNFLKGKSDDYDTYGMLFEGVWWVNESNDSFSSLANRYGKEYAKENRNIAYMPLPVATAEDVGRGYYTLLNSFTSLGFIRANTDIMECAKAFLQFTSTDAELSAFTASVSMTRALNYEITKEYEDKLSPYAKSVHDLKSDSKVIYPYLKEGVYINNQSLLNIENWGFGTVIDGSTETNPWTFWIATKGANSVEKYFEGMYENQKIKWSAVAK